MYHQKEKSMNNINRIAILRTVDGSNCEPSTFSMILTILTLIVGIGGLVYMIYTIYNDFYAHKVKAWFKSVRTRS